MDDLTKVIKETLDKSGALAEARGRLRAEVFRALEDQSIERPKVPSENILINELIREYLSYNEYHHTSSVLAEEARQPAQTLGRSLMCSELNMKWKGPNDMPLLYGIISHFTEQHTPESGANINNKSDEDEDEEDTEFIKPTITIIKK